MRSAPLVPPLKCQGIKTKLVSEIKRLATGSDFDRWIEPFCGSCVVALNVQPKRALLCDTNLHIITCYQDIQTGRLTPGAAREFLREQGQKLKAGGEQYYYEVRSRFNDSPNSLEFLFLNRSCFNGVMRFNRRGHFNVPYCHKPDRFAPAYVTKITNQIRAISEVISASDWEFRSQGFGDTLGTAGPNDIVYADPPYAGRHVDYYNSWSDADEEALAVRLRALPCRFILSTWHSNEFRHNPLIQANWDPGRFHILLRQHFYHVGSAESLRHPMTEALITNFTPPATQYSEGKPQQSCLFEEVTQYGIV